MDVLLLDDDPIASTILHITLERCLPNVNCDIFLSVKEAELAYKNKDYNYMFVDFFMPGETGLEFIEKYLNFCDFCKKIPSNLFLLSANELKFNNEKFKCLLKPIKLNDLNQIFNK